MNEKAENLIQKARNVRSGNMPEPVQRRGKGRPPIIVDMDVVRKLGRIQCSIPEIAAFFDIDDETLTRQTNFHAIYANAKEHGKRSLRRVMFRKAIEGDNGMLVWLSKQYFGMHEPRQEHTVMGDKDKPLEVNIKLDSKTVAEALAVLVNSGALKQGVGT